MFPVADQFDVYVSATGPEPGRRATLARLRELHPLDEARSRAFVAGERVLLKESLADAQAKHVAIGLRALGLRVDIEARGSALAMVEIDDFAKDEPAKAIAPTNDFFDINAGLVGLDGKEDDAPLKPSGAPAVAPQLDGLMSVSLSEVDEPLAPQARPKPSAAQSLPLAAAPLSPAPPPVPPPRPAAAPEPPRPADRFRPDGAESANLGLELDVRPPDPMLSQPVKQETVEVPRCPTHGVPRVGGRCPVCDANEAAVRGKLFQGRLRRNTGLRIGLGLGAGLFIGWIITAPMARRAEQQVEFIREEARREAARPTEEAQAHARQLSEHADEEAQSSFFRTLAVWAVITGVVTAAWYKLT